MFLSTEVPDPTDRAPDMKRARRVIASFQAGPAKQSLHHFRAIASPVTVFQQ